MRMTKLAVLFLSLSLVLGFACAGVAADFPTKPIRYIVPFPAGGGTDLYARLIAKPLERDLKTKIYVENIPGGSTKVGTMECMKAKPDGYTIMQASELAWLGVFYSKSIDFKIWEKLTPLGNIATQPYGLWEVRAESPLKTFADLLKAAKENPGKSSCGVSSRGVYDIMIEDVERAAGIQIKHVPFLGGGPSEVALLGGHIDFRVCVIADGAAMLHAGKTRGLAVQTEKRLPRLPDVPTLKELGYDVMTVTATQSIWGPPNMPQNIVNIFSKAIEKATKDPEFVKTVEETFLSKAEFRPGPKMTEVARDFDKQLGPKMAEFYSR
jgi:tripartite-type tricarboxylate transporter receptor subunit TctC